MSKMSSGCWLTEFTGEYSYQKQQSAEERCQFHSSNSFRNYNGSFLKGSLDNEIIMFFRLETISME